MAPIVYFTFWFCRAVWSARYPVTVEAAGSNPVRTAKILMLVAPRSIRDYGGPRVGSNPSVKVLF